MALLSACSPAAPGPDRVFVSDERANIVHVLDGLSGKSEGTLTTGKRPRGLVLSPDGRTLFVAASDANRIEVWDTRILRHLRDIGPVSDPERLALSADGQRLFTASEDTGTALEIDAATGRTLRAVPVGPEPEGVGVSPDGSLLAVTSEVASVAHIIGTDGTILQNLAVGNRPRDALFVKAGRELWVSSELRGSVRIFAMPGGQPLGLIDLAAAMPDKDRVQAVELKAGSDGKRVYVALGRGDGVAEVDTSARQVLRTFSTGHRTWGIALSPDGQRLYAAAGLSGDLTIIDLATGRTLHTVHLDGRPWTAVATGR